MFDIIENTTNQQVFLSVLKEKKVELFIKREDTIHPFVSGNKYRKLKYNIEEAIHQKKQTLLTFGGAFSNHIAAVASAGNLSKLKTIGIIRGEELANKLDEVLVKNATLKHAYENGMHLKFVSREDYRKKEENIFIEVLKEEFGDFYLIPEGGTNELAIRGCKEILQPKDEKFDYICCAIGTGGTISGIINSVKNHQKVIGFPALKGDFLQKEIESLAKRNDNWELTKEYHFGGYGKFNEELIRFINQFKKETKIPLDPIYTGKMLFGIIDMVSKNSFPEGSKILAIHTGGLQGIKGANEKLKNKGEIVIE
ncbi:1-aminocyclopropane-1-carboxylate deaminase [Tenacibaculum sp. 190524A02b]|uniref:1-aminocyclopropane-1-carboxylate deaminase n=1 Tax=Tenacibaculum vairaonense TaxID=3137860 RepID=A0ABM9PIA8_9FLAO